MFTGIIEEIGAVRRLGSSRLEVAARLVLEGTRLGDSLAVNGVCLTVTGLSPASEGGGWFGVEIMPETLRRSNLGQLRPGERVNLERALTPSSRLGGHFVQGHVDAAGRLLALTPEDNAIRVRIGASSEVRRYVVSQGFIAVDGASLTVAEVLADSFVVSLVPYTQRNVTLAEKHPGDAVNLEADILAKYVESLLPGGSRRSGLTEGFLLEHGYGGRTG